jgi:hypothetical protein
MIRYLREDLDAWLEQYRHAPVKENQHERRDRQYLPKLSVSRFRTLARLPGKALAVYLVLALKSRQARSKTVPLSTTTLHRFGLTRNDKARALPHLEAAGLLTVERRPRKNPVVTLVNKE